MSGLFPASPDLAGLIARFVLGLLMLTHGWPKIKDVRKTVAFVQGTGWPGGATFAILFTLLEFFGGIALLLGLLTQIVAALFVLEMIATTIFSKSKLKKKFSGGYELDLAYAGLALVVLVLGPGAWSIDAILHLA
jgi:putative oxidoreductase